MRGLFARPPVKSTARYWIAIDRSGEMDYDEGFHPDGHDGQARNAVAQLACELQSVMDETGLPVGFFRIIGREVIDERERPLDLLATHYEDGKVSG